MGAPRLGRLIAAATLEPFLAAARALTPGLESAVLDRDGTEVVRVPPNGPSDGASVAPGAGGTPSKGEHDPAMSGVARRTAATRDLRVGDELVGSLVLGGVDAPTASLMAELLGRAIEVMASQGAARRAVTAGALDDLRELAVLARLAESVSGALDPAAIAGCVLSAVSRPLDPAVGMVLGPDDAAVLAASGSADLVAALRAAAGPTIARLRAEDPAAGSCAEIAVPSDGDRLGSVLAAFLRTARGHHGTIVLGRAAGSPSFTPADRRLLASVASQSALAIERADLQRQVVERRAIDQELAVGRRIQFSLMPRRFPEIEGWEVASAYEPAREVGGDFYDVFRLRDRGACIGLVVADVTGKGIPAAILMADARGLIHAAADHSDGPVETLVRVNRILVDERASGLFVTVVHAVLDPATGRLVLARAGHDPVHVLRAAGRLEILDPPGRLIGMVADLEASSIELVLEPGDAFVAHTDGITEARSTDGSFYGEERFRALLMGLAGRPPSAIVAAIVADVGAFRGSAELSDDLTLLVVGRSPVDND